MSNSPRQMCRCGRPANVFRVRDTLFECLSCAEATCEHIELFMATIPLRHRPTGQMFSTGSSIHTPIGGMPEFIQQVFPLD